MFGGLNEITEDLYTNNSTFGGERGKKTDGDGRRKQTHKTRAGKIHSGVDSFA